MYCSRPAALRSASVAGSSSWYHLWGEDERGGGGKGVGRRSARAAAGGRGHAAAQRRPDDQSAMSAAQLGCSGGPGKRREGGAPVQLLQALLPLASTRGNHAPVALMRPGPGRQRRRLGAPQNGSTHPGGLLLGSSGACACCRGAQKHQECACNAAGPAAAPFHSPPGRPLARCRRCAAAAAPPPPPVALPPSAAHTKQNRATA